MINDIDNHKLREATDDVLEIMAKSYAPTLYNMLQELGKDRLKNEKYVNGLAYLMMIKHEQQRRARARMDTPLPLSLPERKKVLAGTTE